MRTRGGLTHQPLAVLLRAGGVGPYMGHGVLYIVDGPATLANT